MQLKYLRRLVRERWRSCRSICIGCRSICIGRRSICIGCRSIGIAGGQSNVIRLSRITGNRFAGCGTCSRNPKCSFIDSGRLSPPKNSPCMLRRVIVERQVGQPLYPLNMMIMLLSFSIFTWR